MGTAEAVENVAPVAHFRQGLVYTGDANGVGEAEVKKMEYDAPEGVERLKLAKQARPINGKTGGAVGCGGFARLGGWIRSVVCDTTSVHWRVKFTRLWWRKT